MAFSSSSPNYRIFLFYFIFLSIFIDCLYWYLVQSLCRLLWLVSSSVFLSPSSEALPRFSGDFHCHGHSIALLLPLATAISGHGHFLPLDDLVLLWSNVFLTSSLPSTAPLPTRRKQGVRQWSRILSRAIPCHMGVSFLKPFFRSGTSIRMKKPVFAETPQLHCGVSLLF